MTPHIDNEHHDSLPLAHDLYYVIIDGAPVLVPVEPENITDA